MAIFLYILQKFCLLFSILQTFCIYALFFRLFAYNALLFRHFYFYYLFFRCFAYYSLISDFLPITLLFQTFWLLFSILHTFLLLCSIIIYLSIWLFSFRYFFRSVFIFLPVIHYFVNPHPPLIIEKRPFTTMKYQHNLAISSSPTKMLKQITISILDYSNFFD